MLSEQRIEFRNIYLGIFLQSFTLEFNVVALKVLFVFSIANTVRSITLFLLDSLGLFPVIFSKPFSLAGTHSEKLSCTILRRFKCVCVR